MKAILEFNLDSEEDRLNHMRCVKATNAYLALYDIHQALRNAVKHDNSDLESVYDLFNNILDIRDINLFEELE